MKEHKQSFDKVFTDKTSGNRKFLSTEYKERGLLAIVDQGQNEIAGFTDEIDAVCRIKLPCVLFGDHTKKFQYQESPFALGADGVKALEISDDIEPKYAYYALTMFRFPSKTGYSRHYKFLKEASIPLPPLAEQRRIAAILDKVDVIRRKRQQSLELAGSLLKSVFLEMFGDPVTNPKGWGKGTIRDIVSDVSYGTSKPANDGGKYIYLRMNNITYNGFLDLTSVKHIDATDSDFKKYSVRKGDVLFNRTNSKELVGKTCVFSEYTSMIIAGYIIRVRVNSKAVPQYLSAILNSSYGKATLLGMCKSIIGQANINAQELQDIKILIPPIDLQRQFANAVGSIEVRKRKLNAHLAEADQAFKSLQQSFFG